MSRAKLMFSDRPSPPAEKWLRARTIRMCRLSKNPNAQRKNRKLNRSSFELPEDPLKLYRDFKRSGNHQANDLLISYLRSKLKNPKFRDRYKDNLKKMINDFYPPEEKQFQEAAYYNYLGDLQKSLDLYLDLEKKSAGNPSLRAAPKLNIANTFYDLGRFQEALPYYQAALAEYTSGPRDVIIPSSNEMVRYIEGRIEDVQRKVNL